MNFEELFDILDTAVFAKTGKHLKDVDKFVFLGTWQGKTYDAIAKTSDYYYTSSYLKQDVGPKLWRLASEVLGEKVSKTNFRAALERRSPTRNDRPTQKLDRGFKVGENDRCG